jgi:Cu(I)/Ag(I) efflux system membrane fusion protein
VKTIALWVGVIALAAAVLAMGYWWGSAKPVTSDARLSQPPGAQITPLQDKAQGRILYYRNPMGHPDTSPVPKKDSMGMDYLPVYEGEESAFDSSVVKISTEKIQKLGVRTEVAALREITHSVRAVATVQADERRLYIIAPKFEGWIHRLHVNTTGQVVKEGQALMDVYSPELITAQHEYLIAKKGMKSVEGGSFEVRAGMHRLAESALQRLRNWDIPESDLQTLQHEGRVRQYVPFRSGANGVVLEKPPIAGQRFMPGEILYQIADLSRVWMLADVFEQDLPVVHRGQGATISMAAYPGKVFNGEVTFIYPTVNPGTRTVKVRIELPNKEELLKPAMYGSVAFAPFHGKDKVLVVPGSAVLDKGIRQLVLVDLGEGRFEPRTVKLGRHADDYAEVREGLVAGEAVVVRANFLIDAESNLKAALGGFSHSSPGSMPGENEQIKSRAAAAAPPPASHRGIGSIEALDWAHATVTIAHDPIASLSWPAMTMDFRVTDPALLRSLKPGQKIDFEIVEEYPGEYLIVRIQPLTAGPAASNRGSH